MTRMLPSEISSDANSGETRIFEAIRDAKGSDGWFCLHSVGIARHKRKQYAECDFVLITEHGVFCLEVKAGEVSRTDGTWKIGWPGRYYYSKEGPFKQSQSAMQALIRELNNSRGKAFKRKVLFGWGVVFPYVEFAEADPEWDLSVVYDRNDTSQPFRNYIERLAAHTRDIQSRLGRKFPSSVDLATRLVLVDEFRHDFCVVPLLGDVLTDSREELVRLSEGQYRVLEYALNEANPRVLCPGGAGTGKTVVAVEAARRIASSGQTVLFLCFNRLLADHLVRNQSLDQRLVTVRSIDRFMRDRVVSAGLEHELAVQRHKAGSDHEFFDKQLPELFEMALLDGGDDSEQELYDVLIVDEGQDILHSPLIDALGLVITNGWSGGRWLVFYDPDLQSAVYGRFDPAVLSSLSLQGAAKLPLFENFRNPEPIVSEMARLTGIEKPVCRRVLPVRMRYISFSSADEEGEKLNDLLNDIRDAGVKPNDICVLSARRREKSCIQKNKRKIESTVTYLDKNIPASIDPNSVLAASIPGFKGLEADVVILTDMPMLTAATDWQRSAWYVGMTRCTTKLYALVHQEFIDEAF